MSELDLLDRPTIEYVNGRKEWYKDGKLHREKGPAIEYPDGTKYWFLNGLFHREDGPAIEHPDGSKQWYLNGKRHRVDGPAIEWANGGKEWWLNGKFHRVDGPAIEYADGYKEWYLNHQEYSESDWKVAVEKLKREREESSMKKEANNKLELPVLEIQYAGEQIPNDYTGIVKYSDGSREWYLNGELHREDGPAVERANGTKWWYLNGNSHRVDGPAVERADGYKEWWLNGIAYTEANWKVAVEKLKKEREPELPVLELKSGKFCPYNYTGIVKYPDGGKEWRLNGFLHRVDGPAVEYPNGDKFWLLNGESHRVDGPAIEWANGGKEWWLNGKFHRVDGPAIERADGSKAWYLNHQEYSESDWKVAVEKLKSERGSLTVETPVTTVSEDASAPPATVQGAAKEESKSKDQKTMSKMDNLKKVAKSDMTETGKRVAADQMSKAATAALVKILSDGKSEKEAKSIRKQLTEALETPGGRMVISMMMGCIGPALKDKFPAEYQTIVDDISKELRVQAETHAARAGVDMMTPVIKAGLEGVQSAFDGVLAVEEKEKTVAATSVRADLPKGSVGKIPTETHEVEAVKDTLKKNKK